MLMADNSTKPRIIDCTEKAMFFLLPTTKRFVFLRISANQSCRWLSVANTVSLLQLELFTSLFLCNSIYLASKTRVGQPSDFEGSIVALVL